MKYTLLLSAAGLLTMNGFAQTPEDVLRYSGTNPKASARIMAIGGAMGSLGGDIHATFVNPAGLGQYKTSELVLSPGFQFLSNKGNFRGSDQSANKNNFSFGTSGFVFGYGDRYSKWTSKAFSIAVNRTADFNNRFSYRGQNDFSSFSEQYAEEFANSGLPIDETNDRLSLGTNLALYNYLIDTATINGNLQVVGLPWRDALINNTGVLLSQQKDVTTKGGVTEIAIGFAGNRNDKFMIGGSVGIPIMNYSRTTYFREADETGNTNNNFNYASYYEEYSSKGVGLNAKLGVMFKPEEYLRLGAAIHTPTIYGMDETFYGKMVRDIENYPDQMNINVPGLDSADSRTIYGNSSPEIQYDVTTPWKFIASASYVIRETEDTRRQKGFITADVEYVTYNSSRFRDGSTINTNNDQFYTDLNDVVKDYYKGVFNFRLGGELKFHTIMARAGFAYYGNPYEDEALKNNRMLLSGGLGYRDNGIFIDLTYVHNVSKDVNFPYRLGDKPNTFADIKGNYGNVALTFGVKL